MKSKNFLCTNALIHYANEDIEYLKGAWLIVLGRISVLDKMKDNDSFVCDLSITENLLHENNFRKCINKSIGILCQMIESDDADVRKEIIEILKRCFNNQ